MSGLLSYKHDAVTRITDYLPVTKIFWNKRFANIIKGLKYFAFQFNFHNYKNSSHQCIMKAVEFSLNNFWLQNLNWAYSGRIVLGCTYYLCVYWSWIPVYILSQFKFIINNNGIITVRSTLWLHQKLAQTTFDCKDCNLGQKMLTGNMYCIWDALITFVWVLMLDTCVLTWKFKG